MVDCVEDYVEDAEYSSIHGGLDTTMKKKMMMIVKMIIKTQIVRHDLMLSYPVRFRKCFFFHTSIV